MGGGRGRLFNNENPSCCDKTWKREWQVTGYLFCTNYLQTLCILKKERKLHPVGFCWKEYIYTWADGVTSFIRFLIISGQRYVALRSGYILH